MNFINIFGPIKTLNNCWMIRAGHGAKQVQGFKDKNLVAIGWERAGDFSKLSDRQSLIAHIAGNYPDNSYHQNRAAAGQIFRFLHEIRTGDAVLTYDSMKRIYLLGKVASSPAYDKTLLDGLHTYRKVIWCGEIDRDRLSTATKNSLGGIMTLFKLPSNASAEIYALASGSILTLDSETEIEEDDETDLLKETQEKAFEFIKDKISRLDWEQMQVLVAEILVAMGYKTRISPQGPDRGKDIIASPDGFGFEQPRIIVEVKRRKDAMGAPEIRSFLGGRHKDDKGLYVSTGGFTAQAQYEAERAPIPLTLLDLNDLVRAFIDNYETMRMEGKALIPLTKIFWPSDPS
jgi:restriction system protein